MRPSQISANSFGNEVISKLKKERNDKGSSLKYSEKTPGKKMNSQKQSLHLNFTFVRECFGWKFAEKARFRGFDVF